MTQPKEKKIVTRKLSNKVSQLLTDFLCTDKLTYWKVEVVIFNKETAFYLNFDPIFLSRHLMWDHVSGIGI